jgi:hypothetical protein
VTDGRASPLGRDEQQQLAEIGAHVITKDVRRFEGSDGQLQALRFDEGSTLPVSAAFFAIEHQFQRDWQNSLDAACGQAAALRSISTWGPRLTVSGGW